MRVALYHNLPPGGALRVLREFVRRTAGEHEYHLYTVDLAQLGDFAAVGEVAEQHDITPHVVRSFRYPVVGPGAAPLVSSKLWRVSSPAWLARTQRAIAADINRGGYDAVFVHPCQVEQSPSLLRYLDVPSLYYMQEYRRRSYEAGYRAAPAETSRARRAVLSGVERVLRRRDRSAALAADRIIGNSCYSAESIQRIYGRDVTVCYPGIDTATFSLGSGPASTPRETLLSVGALDEVKGHELVVRAVSLLPPARRPSIDFVYERCDEGYRQRLEALAASGGVEVRFRSGISDPELAGLYRQASVTVVAARLEPLGLVPVESLACGTPVVAVREAGYRETVQDGINGYLVERSPSAVADAVCRVMSGALGRPAEQVRETVVPRWDWDTAVKPLLEMLAATAEGERR